MKRRNFLKPAGLTAAAVVLPRLARAAGGSSTQPRKPNILFLFSDQQRHDTIECYGKPIYPGLTPNIDRMAANGVRFSPPCLESSLGMANIIQNMLIQSWSDPAKAEPGPIRIFPALPSSWKDVEFRDLRAEGAFLVSAKREGGKTKWIRIKSLAGEPCRLRPAFEGEARIKGTGQRKLAAQGSGIYAIDLKQGEEVLLVPAGQEE